MRHHGLSKRTASFVFSTGTLGVFLVVAGVLGFRPRRFGAGTWSDAVLWDQVLFGAGCLIVSALLFRWANRRLADFDWKVEPDERRSLPPR